LLAKWHGVPELVTTWLGINDEWLVWFNRFAELLIAELGDAFEFVDEPEGGLEMKLFIESFILFAFQESIEENVGLVSNALTPFEVEVKRHLLLVLDVELVIRPL
jgi:hypothetical protein